MKIRRVAAVLAVMGCAGTPPPEAAAPAGDPAAAIELPRAAPGVLKSLGATMGVPLWPLALDEAEAQQVASGLVAGARREADPAALSSERREQIAAFLAERAWEVARREEVAGRAVLEAAAREPGAVQRESGLVLTELEPGEGAPPKPEDSVLLHYHGTLRDGTVFSTTREREPRRFQPITTVRCWQEALAEASPGARLHLVCPPRLGYGLDGSPPAVPGGAVLIFDIEVLEVIPKEEQE